MDEKTDRDAAGMKEKLENTEEPDGNDRRDFLKTAAKAAGAVAVMSALGTLMEDEAEAATSARLRPTANLAKTNLAARNLSLNVAKTEKRKQFGLAGKDLGQVLQNEGFIPGNIKNLEKAALHISVSW
ncbi:ubiquinol-cytochrome c reductase iron-sulfur subunit N-terminal domain-containing protein [Candidatus Poribacteria bacterium]